MTTSEASHSLTGDSSALLSILVLMRRRPPDRRLLQGKLYSHLTAGAQSHANGGARPALGAREIAGISE
jgi:hypothetical protein